MILASTNTQELCRPGRLDQEIAKALGHRPKSVKLPEVGATAGEIARLSRFLGGGEAFIAAAMLGGEKFGDGGHGGSLGSTKINEGQR